MKKFFIFILIFLLSFSLFSESKDGERLEYRPRPFVYRAMGEAGLSLNEKENGFYVNPASLSSNKFSLILPKLEVGIGSVYDILSIPFGSISSGDVKAIEETLGKISGTIPILNLKGSVLLNVFGFGLSGDISSGIYTSGEGASMGLVPFIKYGVTIGYGREILKRDDYSLSLGGVMHSTGLMYSSPIGVSSLLAIVDSNSLDSITLSQSSLTFSFDFGGTFRLKKDFSLAIGAKGIGGDYAVINLLGDEAEIYSHSFSLDLGFGWEHSFARWLSVKTALDFVDLTRLFSDFNFSNLLYHTNMGVMLNFTKHLGLMAGLKGGFPSFGVDLSLWFFNLSLLYTTDEYSDKIGYNPRDTLSLIIALDF